jgi:hypothetical protein
LTWTDDNLLRQVVYQGLREDKPAAKVRARHHTRNLLNPRARLPGQSGLGPADRRRPPRPREITPLGVAGWRP